MNTYLVRCPDGSFHRVEMYDAADAVLNLELGTEIHAERISFGKANADRVYEVVDVDTLFGDGNDSAE